MRAFWTSSRWYGTRLGRYFLAGAVSYSVDLVTLIQADRFGVGYGLAFASATAMGTTCSFLLARYFVFQGSRGEPLFPQVRSFALISGTAILLNWLLGILMDELLGDIPVLYLAIIRTGLLVVAFLAKYWALILLRFK